MMKKKNFRLYAAALAGLVITSSCVDSNKDYYDSEFFQENYIISDVPADFDWATLNKVNVTVTPYDRFDGEYYSKIEIFSSNPNLNAEAVLLTSGVCNKQNPMTVDIEVPSAISNIYLKETTADGFEITIEQNIENVSEVNCNFNPSAAAQSAAPKRVAAQTEDEDYTADFTIPANATEIQSGWKKLPWADQGTDFVLSAGNSFNGKLQFNNDDRLYIAGDMTLSDASSIYSCRIYILEGGSLTLSGTKEISLAGSSLLAIQTGAKLSSTATASIDFKNDGGVLFNEGEINIYALTLTAGSDFYNYADATFGKLTTNTGGTNIFNHRNITVTEKGDLTNSASITNNGTFKAKSFYSEQSNFTNNHFFIVEGTLKINRSTTINNCYIEADELSLEQDFTTNSANCSIKCNQLVVSGNQLNLEENSLLHVTEMIKADSQTTHISGTSSNYALIKAEEISMAGWMTAEYTGNLQIECEKYTENTQYFWHYTSQPSVQWVKKGMSTIEMPESECSTGNTSSAPSKPGNPSFPFIEENNSVYTFVIEDNYPKIGDYDMNDVVMTLTSRKISKTADNLISDIVFTFEFNALGATRQLGLALQLDQVESSNIASVNVEGTEFFSDMFSISNGLEQGQNMPVIPIFDDAHKLFGVERSQMINTYVSKNQMEKKVITVSVAFNTPVETEALDAQALNLFVAQYTGNKTRGEIHLPGRAHSSKSSIAKQIITDTSNLMWALLIPGKFAYPVENKDIKLAYPKFENWVKSNKTQDSDWYEYPNEDSECVITRK